MSSRNASPLLEPAIAVAQVDPPLANRLHLGALEHQARLERLEEVVVVPRLAVVGNEVSASGSSRHACAWAIRDARGYSPGTAPRGAGRLAADLFEVEPEPAHRDAPRAARSRRRVRAARGTTRLIPTMNAETWPGRRSRIGRQFVERADDRHALDPQPPLAGVVVDEAHRRQAERRVLQHSRGRPARRPCRRRR